MEKLQANITDIQRFSLNDGPGIRTTVFFKGCNMRCSWCHNPETISFKEQVHFYPNKCIGCGKCFSACTYGAHSVKDGVHTIDRDKCVGCGKCASVCYAEALTMSGKCRTVDEIMKEIVQDKPYYEESGGGVTLSGGEVLCQREFAKALIAACKENGIKVAVETNLNFAFEDIKEILASVDLIMCDMKIFDDENHKKHTGVSNKNILKNIEMIPTLGVDFIVRTPLIPSITDTKENIESIASFLKPLKNLVRYELLNFNPLGAPKYKSLDMHNEFEAARPLPEDNLKSLSEYLDKVGVPYKII